MLKKILLGGALALVLVVVAVSLWAKSALGSDAVRSALAEKVGQAIGQPVSIGSIGATVIPRVSVTLGGVTIGPPNKVSFGQLHVGTDLRALLSRKIEHASLTVTGARIELPLPEFTIARSSEPTETTSTAPPVELVSIDEIVLTDVQVVSGGRTVRGDIELVPQGTGVTIRKIALGLGETAIDITGQITDLAGPKGDVSIKAGALDLNQLLTFATEFAAGAGESGAVTETPPSASAASPAPPEGMDVRLALDVDSASMGTLTLKALKGTARISGQQLAIDPVSFGIFDGQYTGTLTLTAGETLRFKGTSTLSNVDMAQATTFAGSPNAITGRLSGQLEMSGAGADPATVARTVSGNARIDIVDGVVKNLGLISSVVAATSMRSDSASRTAATAASGSSDEPFTKVHATLAMAGGLVRTNDLVFEAKDLTLTAQGVLNLVASTLDLKGRVQLSEELTRSAGVDLVRYTQEQGRVTLPATITGPIDAPSVRIDTADLAKRAVKNAVTRKTEEAKAEAMKKAGQKLNRLFGR